MPQNKLNVRLRRDVSIAGVPHRAGSIMNAKLTDDGNIGIEFGPHGVVFPLDAEEYEIVQSADETSETIRQGTITKTVRTDASEIFDEDALFRMGLLAICAALHSSAWGCSDSDQLPANVRQNYADYLRKRLAGWRASYVSRQASSTLEYDNAVRWLCRSALADAEREGTKG